MKTNSLPDESPKVSELHLTVTIKDSWLQAFADEKKLVIPLKEKYHLHQLHFSLFKDEVLVKAGIQEKPESVVELLGKPRWDASSQRLYFDEVKIETKTKSIIIKSAGWVASKLLHEKMDRMLEEKLNEIYLRNLQKLIAKALEVRIKNESRIKVEVQKIFIRSMSFVPGMIEVNVDVSGIIKLDLIC